MTGAEARARYMLALAARAFSDEQMRVLAAADVVDDDDGYAELERAAAELPAHEAAALIAALTSSSVLGEDVLAELRRILEYAPAVGEPALIEAGRGGGGGRRRVAEVVDVAPVADGSDLLLGLADEGRCRS